MVNDSRQPFEDDRVCCPSCGGRVRYQTDCPGYPVGTSARIVVCSPRCGNAHYWECAGSEAGASCGWSYREPNSRRDGRGVKPDWLEWVRPMMESDVDSVDDSEEVVI